MAGVSVATVSRVLNKPTVVSKATRENVERAIETLKFVPSSSARAINSGRTRLVGALIPTLDHAIFSRFIDAMEVQLDASGLSLIVATTGYDADRELDKTKRLLNIGVEGLIVSGIARADGFQELVERHQVPVIATSCFEPDRGIPSIGYDNFQVGKDAVDHLRSLGHSNIAILSGPIADNDRTRGRLSGALTAGEAVQTVLEAELSFSSAAETSRKILTETPNVTAFLCLSDVLAQGALLYLSEIGVQVPRDISIIGIDDLPSSASFNPPLTSIHLPVVDMGKEAAAAITQWIEADIEPSSKKLEAEIRDRGSTIQV